MRRHLLGGVVTVALTACGHDFDPPDPAARVERAAASYRAELFDSIRWGDADARILLGNTVYAERCTRCHGPLGAGGTDYARLRGLEVPSLVEPDWRLQALDSLRRKLFVGHESGMPSFGDHILSPREIDATAAYILLTLRPEVDAAR